MKKIPMFLFHVTAINHIRQEAECLTIEAASAREFIKKAHVHLQGMGWPRGEYEMTYQWEVQTC